MHRRRGHYTLIGASRQSLKVYSRLAIGEAQAEYNSVMGRFPV